MLSFIVIMFLCGVITIFYGHSENEVNLIGLGLILAVSFSMLFVVNCLDGQTYTDGVKDMLKGKDVYKINYNKINDSIYVPIDTVILFKK